VLLVFLAKIYTSGIMSRHKDDRDGDVTSEIAIPAGILRKLTTYRSLQVSRTSQILWCSTAVLALRVASYGIVMSNTTVCRGMMRDLSTSTS
jgi:hypothetical protein